MSDEQGPGEVLTDRAAKVVVAGTAAQWPNKKVLLAVLPPTFALLIAVVGVWEGSSRDRAAAAQAEKDRIAAATLAEEARADEAARELVAAEKERQLREAALVLPRYETLITEVRAVTNAAYVCREDLENWLEPGGSGWNRGSVGTASTLSSEGGPSGEVVSNDEPFLESCKVIGDLDALQLAVDKALVISNPKLQEAAVRLENTLVDASDVALHLSDAPQAANPAEQTFVVSGVDADGRDFRSNVQRLSGLLEESDIATQELIDVVRGVLLPGQ